MVETRGGALCEQVTGILSFVKTTIHKLPVYRLLDAHVQRWRRQDGEDHAPALRGLVSLHGPGIRGRGAGTASRKTIQWLT